MKRSIIALLALTTLYSAATWAGARERLQGFYHNTHSLTAEFTQTVRDAKLVVVEDSRGLMALQRPGKFRWDYYAPHEQTIVADGNKVWLYDIDLEQVTVKPMDNALGNTPAQLLSTSRPLEESFVITELPNVGGLEWVELTPRDKDANFRSVRLGFDGDHLKQMELEDSFGQITLLTYSNIQRNPPLESSLFTFTPPQGVDVIGE